MTITEKVAYIQGMFDGMDLDKADSKEARILSEILDVLKEVGDQLDNVDATLDEFSEEIDAISDDLFHVGQVVRQHVDLLAQGLGVLLQVLDGQADLLQDADHHGDELALLGLLGVQVQTLGQPLQVCDLFRNSHTFLLLLTAASRRRLTGQARALPLPAQALQRSGYSPVRVNPTQSTLCVGTL